MGRVLSIAILLLAAPCLAQQYNASGTITHNGKTLTLRAASAVWNAAENELSVGLYPFLLTRADRDEVRKSGPLFVAAEKASPDPAVWPSAPFAEVVITLTPGSGGVTASRVEHYVLHASWIDRMNFTLSANRNSQEEVSREFARLSGGLSEGSSLEFSFKGSERFEMGGDDRLEWAVEVRTTVMVKR